MHVIHYKLLYVHTYIYGYLDNRYKKDYKTNFFNMYYIMVF